MSDLSEKQPRDRTGQAETGDTGRDNPRPKNRFRKQNGKKHKKHRVEKPDAEAVREGGAPLRQNKPQKPKSEPDQQHGQDKRPKQQSWEKGKDREKDRRRERKRQDAPTSPDRESPRFAKDDLLPPEPPAEVDEFSLFRDREEEELIEAMPPDPTLDYVFGEPPAPEPEPEDGVEIVGVHFPQGAKVYYFDPVGRKIERGTKVIVETARGLELGEVAIGNRKVPPSDHTASLKPVIRIATPEDIAHVAGNASREAETMKICAAKVEARKLDMKLVGAQYTFDNSKLIVYFTAAQRVDFRELVRDLAQTFRTRIEMSQIGVRDEAKMLGGIGVCGRRLCCSVFLPNYAQVAIKMAKDQGLSLNSAKISGNCGRLLCCLRFEHPTYEKELAKLPTVDSLVETPDGRGKVTDVKPLCGTVKVKLDSAPDAVPGVYSAASITVIKRAAEKPDSRLDREDGGNNGSN